MGEGIYSRDLLVNTFLLVHSSYSLSFSNLLKLIHEMTENKKDDTGLSRRCVSTSKRPGKTQRLMDY